MEQDRRGEDPKGLCETTGDNEWARDGVKGK